VLRELEAAAVGKIVAHREAKAKKEWKGQSGQMPAVSKDCTYEPLTLAKAEVDHVLKKLLARGIGQPDKRAAVEAAQCDDEEEEAPSGLQVGMVLYCSFVQVVDVVVGRG